MIRQRARRACGPCRKRKVKCNGLYPCDICEGYGYECDYSTEPRKRPKRSISEDESRGPATLTSSASNDEGLEKTTYHTESSERISDEHSDNRQAFVLVELSDEKDVALPARTVADPLVSRFTTSYSAIAIPRDLGQYLNLSDAPRLHCYAWNTGMREEQSPNLGKRIFDLISVEDALKYTSIYFDNIHPLVAFLDRSHCTKFCIAAWEVKQMPADFEATICGVIALGSLFSSDSVPWSLETHVATRARALLEMNISTPLSRLSVKSVIAWLLWALYSRCTTRPHIAWIATCNAMHLAEAIGIHQEFGNMDLIRKRPREIALQETAYRRKTFWAAFSLNRLFSLEYGRSPVHLDSIRCSPIEPDEQSYVTLEFVQLCELLPTNKHDPKKVIEEQESLCLALQRLADHTTQRVPFSLLRADVCFSIYRKMRFLRMPMVRPQIEIIIRIIRAGLLEAKTLSCTLSKWWNVLSVVFHSICVLIALDTAASLGMLRNAMETLRSVTDAYNTHLAREALHTAERLVRGYHTKKSEETMWVGQALEVVTNGKDRSIGEDEAHPAPEFSSMFEWPSGDDGGWMEVFVNLNTDI